ncbi:uncharacterized protein VICG_00308 [Vittaforma corneae ATCC 50505]|uniref:Uncharacterized protein n=1 Tax=Vittaforma corneae (strain ATCC 50505) TaxID=993615 RepID=L2GNZ2_VITCO|nr:uncharacterized protein VICG_00308 [Vittaforma corneae ATCC 50505]ELA42556.1 hypothetical protein VICG_00308 [Vittaforma corneae ATCC 50505]
MLKQNKIVDKPRLSAESLSKVLIYYEPTLLQSIMSFSSVRDLLNNNPEILNAFCRTSGYSKQECLRILKSNSILIKAIQKGIENVVTFNTNQSDMTQLSVFNKLVYVSSDDQTLKVFDFNGTPVKKFIGHIGGIWTFDCSGNRVVTGSTDKTARIWDLDSEQTIVTLKYHRSTVRVLKIYGEYIITGSRDYTIAIWSVFGDLVYRLNGHRQSVRCLDVCDGYLASGSYDGYCKLWDYKRGKFIKDVHKHQDKIYCVRIYNDYVASSGFDSEVKISKIDGSSYKSYKVHSSVVGWMDFSDNFLVSSSLDGTVAKYNYISETVDFVIRLGCPIKGQRLTDTLIIIATVFDVRIYSLRTGKFIRTLITADLISKIEVVDWRIIVGYQQGGEYKISMFNYESL